MVAKKSVVKKHTEKVSHHHLPSKKAAPMKSFRMYKDEKPFTTFKITRQTVYWTILLLFIIVTQLYILKVQMDIVTSTTLLVNQ